MEGIIGHNTDGHAIERADMYIKNGRNKQVREKPRVGTYVLNGKMGQQAESVWWISRKATPLKLLSIQLPITCFMPLILYGGPHVYSRGAVGSLLQ
jgi:hypothetical protein